VRSLAPALLALGEYEATVAASKPSQRVFCPSGHATRPHVPLVILSQISATATVDIVAADA
jgi:hypothetical protein